MRCVLPLVLTLGVLAAVLAEGAIPARAETIVLTHQSPAPEAVVQAGLQTIGARIAVSPTAEVSLLLNTEVLPLRRTNGDGWVYVGSDRILAPGNYTVNLVVRDASVGLRTVSWRFQVRLSDPIPAGFQQLDAKIEIVWPHGGAPVDKAEKANIGVFLFTPGTLIPVPMDFDRPVRLWRGIGSSPAQPVAVGRKAVRTVEGRTFPAWEFDNVDVIWARDRWMAVVFYVTVDGVGTNSNVWVHGADARTYWPSQSVFGRLGPWPDEVKATVEVVYPHDGAPVSYARLANVGTDVWFSDQYGSSSVDFSRNPFVHLLRSLNAEVSTYAATGERIRDRQVVGKVTYPEHPRWVFNDIDVSAANLGAGHSLNVILFRNLVEGATTYSNVWVHGADHRTYFPVQDVPSQSAQGAVP